MKVLSHDKEYLFGLINYGGKFDQINTTIETVLIAVSVKKTSDSDVSRLLGVTRKRVSTGRTSRQIIDDIIEVQKEKNNNSNDKSDDETSSSDEYGDIDNYRADFGDDENSNEEFNEAIEKFNESTADENSSDENKKDEYFLVM